MLRAIMSMTALLVCAHLGPPDSPPVARYAISDIGEIDDYVNDLWSHHSGLDAAGQVIGTRYIRTDRWVPELGSKSPEKPIDHPILIGRRRRDLGTPPGGYDFEGDAISPNGKYIGGSGFSLVEADRTYPIHHNLYIYSGGRFQLKRARDDSRVSAINNSGWAVGYFALESAAEHAFLWRNGELKDIDTLATRVPHSSQATAINSAGVIVGMTGGLGGLGARACAWRDGKMELLGLTDWFVSGAENINDRDEIVGSFVERATPPGQPQAPYRAFLYSNGAMHVLPRLSLEGAVARAINNRGVIVGWVGSLQKLAGRRISHVQHAAVWILGQCYELDTLIPKNAGWQLVVATAINDRGQIVGVGFHKGKLRDFLLTPVAQRLGTLRGKRR